MKHARFRHIAAALLLCAAALPAFADVTRDQAAAAAQRETGGRVLSVDRSSDSSGRAIWRVKVVTARGDVRVVIIDAATGRVQ